ncbi:MAG: DUF6089 family protein [Vicingaceae bacterium]
MLKKSLFFLFITLVSFFTAQAQRKTAELGIFIGRSYYLGELNPKTHVGNGVGGFTYGGIFRYNLNKRYTLKATLVRTKIGAADEKVDFEFNQARNASFETIITEFASTIEFNFLPYKTGDKDHFFTPYLFVGFSIYKAAPNNVTIGGAQFNGSEAESKTGLALPFGPGMKLSLGNKWGLAMEWGFRKTSYDAIDGIPNRTAEVFELGKEYDNDWFVVTGFTLTFQITDEGACPVYYGM